MAATAQPIYSIASARARHRGHWFDTASMRFFRSRVGGFLVADFTNARSLFVSSEDFDGRSRRYTVRSIDWAEGTIDTVGTFQEYATLDAAKRAAVRAVDAAARGRVRA